MPGIHMMSRASSRSPTASLSQTRNPPPNSRLPWGSGVMPRVVPVLSTNCEYPPPAKTKGLV